MADRVIRVLPDAEAAGRAAADEVVARARRAVEDHGRFNVALAGGHTPRPMYEILGTEYRDEVPWDRVHVFWGDERCVPPDDPLSNYRMARDALLDRVPLDPGAVHRVPGELGPGAAAAEYHALLTAYFGGGEPAGVAAESSFDLVILGAGTDGHTASLFPGQVEPDDPRWARAVRAPEGVEPPDRVTLTLRALNAADAALFLVVGASKRGVVAAADGADGDSGSDAGDAGEREEAGSRAVAPGSASSAAPPACLVRPPGGALWIVDAAAAG